MVKRKSSRSRISGKNSPSQTKNLKFSPNNQINLGAAGRSPAAIDRFSYHLNIPGGRTRADRRARRPRPRGMSLANSLREAKGGACPPFLRRYRFSYHLNIPGGRTRADRRARRPPPFLRRYRFSSLVLWAIMAIRANCGLLNFLVIVTVSPTQNSIPKIEFCVL